MRKVKSFILLAALLAAGQAGAQSLSLARSYMNSGEYLEAAKQLRPLADGGDAEAQALAAKLFFEGKGVNKNDEQGVKYAKLAADQGNEAAILLLVNHYYLSKKPQLLYKTARSYADAHPYMEKGALGMWLALCYLSGVGVEKDEAKGWSLLQDCNYKHFMDSDILTSQYWLFVCRKYEAADLEGLAEKLSESKRGDSAVEATYNYLVSYLDDILYKKDATRLLSKAEEGNPWAMYHLAETIFNDDKHNSEALMWAQKSSDAGLVEGRRLVQKINSISLEEDDGTEDGLVFTVAETAPEFKGGTAALLRYLKDYIQYPPVCRQNNIQGRVVVQFVVDKDGSIVEPEVIMPVNPYLDKEALRVVQEMPKWTPGTKNGKPVRVKFTLPIQFRL